MKLTSRYGDTWDLEEVDSGYKFKLPDHTRLGYDGDKIVFVDPPGGPFLEIGSILGNKKISEIKLESENFSLIILGEA